MPRNNLPSVLVTILDDGLVRVRTSTEMQVAVVNSPRLRANANASATGADVLRKATRFIKKGVKTASELRAERDAAVAAINGGETIAPREEAFVTYSVPVMVKVEARSAEEARRLAVEDNGGEVTGDPTRVAA